MSKNRRRIPLPEPEIEPVQDDLPPEEMPAEDSSAGENEPEEDSFSNRLSDRLKKFRAALPTRKTRRITGYLCLFAGAFLALAFISHFLYWWIDYDAVQQMRSGSVWTSGNWTVRNFGGRLGAYIASAFINQGFGIASFIFPILLFLGGLQLLNLKNYAWIKIVFRSLFGLLWISLLAGWVCSGKFYVFGGNAGASASHYLLGLTGKIGLGFILAFTLICYLILNYNLRDVRISLRAPKRAKESTDFDIPEQEPDMPGQDHVETVPANETEDLPLHINDDFGMTLSTRIHMPEPEPSTVSSAIPAETVPAAPPKTVFSLDDEPEPEVETPSVTASSVELTINTEEAPKAQEPAPAQEDGPEEEMVVLDTRVVSEQKPVVEPRPEHFGLDTPFDPRLELSGYRFPTLDLLEDFGDQSQKIQDMNEELLENKKRIVETLQNYGIGISKISATIGPTVTLYEIVPAPGVRISKIKNLEDDIALSLSALGIRIIAPIPGKGTIGIEVPNSKKQIVPMRDMLTCEKFRSKDFALPVALGKTISNEEFVADLAKMPHLLVAGATGQGKSVGLNAIVASLLYSKHPAELKFVMVDPKKVELSLYNKIERHYLAKLPDSEDAIITDTRKVVRTLNSLCKEMDNRYDLLKDAGAKNLKEYNKKIIDRKLVIGQPVDSKGENPHRFLPYIVLIIDEFADLIMTAGREVEQPIARLAQLARAIGIHLVIATQRPSVNIITGLIKANFPARIAFKVSQKIDSRTILDAGGADQLIGRGDMLISMGDGLTRLQCPFIDTPEIERITEFIGEQRAYPDAYLLPDCPDENGGGEGKSDIGSDEWDGMFREAAELVVSSQQGSTSMLQRKFKLGYNRAGRIMDQLETAGIVGAFDGRKTREVKIKDPEMLERLLQSLNL
ncbi:MAG: DNA translocase FtsK 4TM domain-containing protein [Bacteroides sp.]|nr:DNA translocase FtsK 4TM domain-containing protein [Bacteroides sp.]MCM1085574.1 DNA translocase FtsK 4TM domain-containing protein [Bacteroides sp.]